MKKILIVEDNLIVLANIGKLLKAEGFQVLSAENGKLGLQLARTEFPDLILSDIMMPELDGYGMLEALRQDSQYSAIPFIFLTAKVERQDMRRAMELGSDDFLTKPFTRDELLKSIGSRLQKQGIISDRAKQQLNVLRENITHSLPHRLLFPALQIIALGDRLSKITEIPTLEDLHETGSNIYQSAKDLHEITKRFLLYANLEMIGEDSERADQLRSQRSTFIQLEITDLAQQLAGKYHRSSDLILNLADETLAVADNYLEEIARELIDNAFKFSGLGTPVEVTGTCVQGSYVLQISDRGQGMTAEQLKSLGSYMAFEEKLYTNQGAGLGIAIVKRLIELHHGSLKIESNPYKITKVEVTLPLANN
jgi:two-component system, sensor histidine kinase and response regulator